MQPEALLVVNCASNFTPVHQLSVGGDEVASSAATAADPVSDASCSIAVQMTVKPEDSSGIVQVYS